MRRYRFARAYARGLVVLGALIICAGIALAAVLVLGSGGARLADHIRGATKLSDAAALVLAQIGLIVVCVVGAIALAAPYIVSGQLILVFLEQRDLLARQRRLLARIQERLASPPDAAAPPRDAPTLADRLKFRR